MRGWGPWDVVLSGEDRAGPPEGVEVRRAVVDLSWFGRSGPCAGWRGSDLIVQALSGMTWPCGPADGPPQHAGDAQSAILGGATAFVAAMAGALDDSGGGPRRLEVSILEAVMCLGELQAADAPVLARPPEREGVNRFRPTCPLGIHRCKEGWLGVTIITPAQWAAFCDMLDLPELADDPDFATIHTRSDHVERLEAAIDSRLPERTAEEWAALGRERRVPMVVVPDGDGILSHPVFGARSSLAPVEAGGRRLMAPRAPLPVAAPQGDGAEGPRLGAPMSPLAGLRIADFSMGWAGPLATRLLADLGAEVIKIEAGRYPDWWRGVDFSPEAVARKQFEESRRFAALNRGKNSVSLNLTTPEGLEAARRLARASDIVIENQAAGVMERLGLGHAALSEGRPELVTVSMSAFGAGNPWSDTRAYGSTLEQGAGLPSFCGAPGWPPTMAHIAYGDPVGGVYGAAAMLAALWHRRRTGAGQCVNLSQIECMLPFAAPGLLAHQALGRAPERLRNRHAERAPQGVFRTAGEDAWLALSVEDEAAWRGLARALGREDWLETGWSDPGSRRANEDEIEAALAEALRDCDALEIAEALQAAGVAAAPVVRPSAAHEDAHLQARGFFHDVDRPYVGPQRQAGTPILQGGRRYPLRGAAPFLGGDSREVLVDALGLDASRFDELVERGVISLQPTALRA